MKMMNMRAWRHIKENETASLYNTPFIRLISLMQAIWKAQSSLMSPRSATRRFWFIWTLRTLSQAIVNGPIAAILLNLNWRRMSKYT